jgi:glycosyltransferase involved in cell wall biosynthesis
MIAFHYPPLHASSGIQRTLKFSNYLPEHGYDPMVLTISPRAYASLNYGQMAEIPAGMIVERAFGLDTSRHLGIRGRFLRCMAQPDRWISWWPAAVWRGMALIRQHKPAAILSTFPIATAHLIGLTLHRLSGLPWIADFRDSMTEPGYPRDPFTWRLYRRIESATVHRCTRAIFTTEGARQMYAERYPEIPANRWCVVENGFDEENFRDAEAHFTPAPPARPGQITLLHSGILYPQERDPRPFFAALRTLKQRGEIAGETLNVVLRATCDDPLYQAMIAEYGIEDIITLAPPVSYRDALREMLSVDGLLVFQAASCNHQIPAKIYEYFRAGRPILALTDPAGNTADTLRAAGIDSIADLASEQDIASALLHFLEGIRQGRLAGVPPDVAARSSRRARTAELASVLDGMLRPCD